MMSTMLAEDRLSQARTRLLLDGPWFGSLSLKLKIEEKPMPEANAAGLATEGTHLWFDRAKVDALKPSVAKTMVAHEVLHCALGHPYRCGGRDPEMYGDACDYVVNLILQKAGTYEFWEGALLDAKYEGMSVEQVYASLKNDKKEREKNGEPEPERSPQPQLEKPPEPKPGDKPSDAPGDKPGDQPGDAPGDQPSDKPDDKPGDGPGGQTEPLTEIDWQIAAEQAALVSRKAGQMSGDVARAMAESRQSRTDWVTATRRWLEQTVPSDYSWTKPNRRYIAQGIYLPGVVNENMPGLAVCVDTSGSIDEEMLARFGTEATAILHELRPEYLLVIYADAGVQHVQRFTPDDAEVKLEPVGGGGTRFQPTLDYLTDQYDQPAGLIYLTDLYGSDNARLVEPSFPVLWVTPEGSTQVAPFGEQIEMEAA